MRTPEPSPIRPAPMPNEMPASILDAAVAHPRAGADASGDAGVPSTLARAARTPTDRLFARHANGQTSAEGTPAAWPRVLRERIMDNKKRRSLSPTPPAGAGRLRVHAAPRLAPLHTLSRQRQASRVTWRIENRIDAGGAIGMPV